MTFGAPPSTAQSKVTRAVPVAQALFCAALGAAAGIAAWGPGRTPAIAAAIPLLWLMAPNRTAAFALAAAYHMAVVRFLPEFAGTWFQSMWVGAAYWIALGLISGTVWALFWPQRSTSIRVVLSVIGLLAVLLVTPLTAIVPAHPIVGWGFLAPRTGWVGVALMFLATAALGWLLRVGLPRWAPGGRALSAIVLVSIFAAAWWMGEVPNPVAGRLAGKVGAIQTELGGFPSYGSQEVGDRLSRIGAATKALAGGEDGISTVVFPEAIIGLYDPSLYPVVKLEIINSIQQTGQTVILGADVGIGGSRFENSALIFRPDGTSSTVAARQTTPFAQWRPWSSDVHFPANWMAASTANVGGGIRARFVFCHEEWMPILHLLSEAREDAQLVIAMANLWAAADPLASFIQSAQTEGMAKLFGRRWVRSVNLPSRESKA